MLIFYLRFLLLEVQHFTAIMLDLSDDHSSSATPIVSDCHSIVFIIDVIFAAAKLYYSHGYSWLGSVVLLKLVLFFHVVQAIRATKTEGELRLHSFAHISVISWYRAPCLWWNKFEVWSWSSLAFVRGISLSCRRKFLFHPRKLSKCVFSVASPQIWVSRWHRAHMTRNSSVTCASTRILSVSLTISSYRSHSDEFV